MFCTHCGDDLTRREGELYCDAGDIGLSPVMETMLTKALDETPFVSVQVVMGRMSPST